MTRRAPHRAGAGRACAGQAALEVIALLPLLVALALLGVQVASVLAAASQAQDRAREKAMGATGESGALVTVTGAASPPALPGIGARAGAVRVRAAVRIP